MTDTLHSRILRTIEDYDRDLNLGLGDVHRTIMASRVQDTILASFSNPSVSPHALATLRNEMTKAIALIDRTLTLASNSDAEKERDEFAVNFLIWISRNYGLDRQGDTNWQMLTEFKETLPKGEFTNPKHNYKSLLP